MEILQLSFWLWGCCYFFGYGSVAILFLVTELLQFIFLFFCYRGVAIVFSVMEVLLFFWLWKCRNFIFGFRGVVILLLHFIVISLHREFKWLQSVDQCKWVSTENYNSFGNRTQNCFIFYEYFKYIVSIKTSLWYANFVGI